MTHALPVYRLPSSRQSLRRERVLKWPSLAPRRVVDRLLWALYNRASEASRRDTFLIDAEAVRLFRSIDCDYEQRFGNPDQSQPMRARLFDAAIRPWVLAHEGGAVVELGCGLETRFQRCDDGDVRWWCVDGPEALAIRESLLPSPSPRCRSFQGDPLELGWLGKVDARKGVFVSAEGLSRYADAASARRLVGTVCERFPGAELMFDVTPRWGMPRALQSFKSRHDDDTLHVPWGLNCDEIEARVRSWSSQISEVTVTPFGARRGLRGLFLTLVAHTPWLRNLLPSVVHVCARAPKAS